jgi:hypothetical protein
MADKPQGYDRLACWESDLGPIGAGESGHGQAVPRRTEPFEPSLWVLPVCHRDSVPLRHRFATHCCRVSAPARDVARRYEFTGQPLGQSRTWQRFCTSARLCRYLAAYAPIRLQDRIGAQPHLTRGACVR